MTAPRTEFIDTDPHGAAGRRARRGFLRDPLALTGLILVAFTLLVAFC